MPARGRPALHRNVHSFEAADCSLPEVVALDSSFAVNALLSGEDHHVNSDGQTIVMVTHNPQIAEAAGRTITMRDGEITNGLGSSR